MPSFKNPDEKVSDEIDDIEGYRCDGNQ